jgi:ATP-dependent Clp protease adaptor protein ClpS
MSGTDILTDRKIKAKIAEPSMWKVVFLNDDHTPIDFVISLLIEVFKHSHDSARNVTMQVHEQGSGVAGTYSYEIAEAKSVEATNLSRSNGFPLQIKMEEE